MSAPAFDVTCEVYVEGTRLADTGDAFAASTPTVLSGLSMIWGRDNVADQPDAASCSLTVADKGADADFLGLLHVGRQLDVYAAGATGSASQPADIAVDGDFETADPAGRVYVAGGSAAVDARASTGTRALRITTAGSASTVWVPPAPYGTTASDWNALPNVTAGETWTVRLSIWLGPGQRGTWQAAMFASPTTHTGTPEGTPVSVPNVAAYRAVSGTWTVAEGVGYGWAGGALSVTLAHWTDATGTWAAAPGSWADWATTLIDTLKVMAPPAAVRRVLMFTGRITDLDASKTAAAVEVAVTASDWTVDLGNDNIGDVPWPVQTITARVARIRQLATIPVAVDIDAAIGALNVTWRDVDSQPVYGLLEELATTGDAILWSAFSGSRGFYLWFEDPAQRQNFGVLAWDPVVQLVVITGNARPASGVTLSACDVLEEPVHWAQDVADVITRVDLTWQEQTTDDQGQPAPTERHVQVVDDTAEAPVAAGGLGYGIRRMAVTTQLISEADGSDVANRVLNRSRALGWHATGLTWDTKIPVEFGDTDRDSLLDLLDGARRIGLPLQLVDLPAWTPAGDTLSTYLEGGTYSFEDGRWLLDMTISPSGMTGYSALWVDLDPAWHWNQFDPAIRWDDCWGLTAVNASPRWSQLDPAHPWSADTHTWQQYWGNQMREAA
jgi:hypothetical protein